MEDTDQRLQRRLVEVTGGETGDLTIATDAELLGSGLEEQLTNFLSDHPETKFVIIDTLQKIRQLKADSYSYAGDYATLTVLKQIADRFDLTILLVHHTRKQEAGDAVDKISGTTGLIGCADGSLILEKENRLGTQGSLTVTSREHPDKKLLLDFDREKKIWQFLSYADSQEEEPEDPILAAVGDFLKDKPSWKGTATELLDALLKININLLAKPNSLVRKLNAKTRELSERYGIRYMGRREENVKYLILERVSDKNDPTVSLSSFADTFRKWCKRTGYRFSLADAERIHSIARNSVATFPKNDSTKLLITQAVRRTAGSSAPTPAAPD